ncbi:hypothetical protein O3P69_016443 [Scylla paramamosain]|uniref:Uncharacterized protein n=1 Tax=Scylla paramamosain TaxID=85552 RepID=A0AAW0TFT7_SCYPA
MGPRVIQIEACEDTSERTPTWVSSRYGHTIGYISYIIIVNKDQRGAKRLKVLKTPRLEARHVETKIPSVCWRE